MGRRLRIVDKQAVIFVTNRCFQQRYLFVPGEDVNRIVLGCLARAVAKHHVKLFAFVFMSNHFHMLLQTPFANLSAFMRDFQSSVARELNRLHGRTGKFFERRFSDEKVLDDDAFLDRLDYILNNPCKDDLVAHISKWPGVTSWSYHESVQPMVGQWLNRKELRRLRRKDEDAPEEDAYEEYELRLATPPIFSDLDDAAAQQRICELVNEGALELKRERVRRRKKCVGLHAILAKKWWERPKNPKKSPRPLCHSSCPKLRKAHREAVQETTDRYREAMGRWREGKSLPIFPHGTFPPGHVRCVGAPPVPPPIVKRPA